MNDSLPPGLAGRLDAAFRCDPHAAHLGIELIDWSEGAATVTNTSRRFSHIGLDVLVGQRKVAAATGITYRTDDWHFGADAWPEAWRSIH